MICANILIYYLLVTCCCCGRYLQLVSSQSTGGTDQSSGHEEAKQQYLSKAQIEAAPTGSELNKTPAAANRELNDVHKLMSEKDLRRTFQVDRHDQVPEYEVLKLQVNQDGSHLISPISDLDELLLGQQSQPTKQAALLIDPRDGSDETRRRHKRETSDRTREANSKLIVIDLSTFGKDFKLRLKRNADFQQRIKDMKMFMAESTQDGQLKYTEVSHPSNQAGKHKQEPHKRAADDESGLALDGEESEPFSASLAGDKKQPKDKPKSAGQSKLNGGWNIGSTYHDEDNLAALLIDHDKKTGQLQLEGTIGNDFVIKPMPKATIEALLSSRRQQVEKKLLAEQQQQQQQHQQQPPQQQSAATNSSGTSRLDKSAEASLSSGSLATSATSAGHNAAGASAGALGQANGLAGERTGGGDLDRAIHMHDDDPHDDDEMFLDEDEAIELAQLQLSANNNRTIGNQTTPSSNLPHHTNGSSARTLSKAASERKWNKYRKLLLAQTQVPKIQQLADQSSTSSLSPAASQGRARRHTGDGALLMSHHIVFRQKPSSMGSSSEHQHSFMISPGSSMERLAFSFQPKREKRDASSEELQQPASPSRLIRLADNDEADAEHDPLGGQFYLEPGSVTGFERAGHPDWSFHQSRFAPHNQTTNGTDQHHRFKRHARAAAGIPMARGGSQVRRKRQAPDTVWPEVLLVVDYDSFLLHNGDSRDVKRYFVSFWNGVDLRYKLLVHPHIRISLAGMIVAKDRDATPYLERNRLRAPNADAVDAAGALTDMGKYLYREDRLPTYDLAVVITKLDMCRRRFEGGRCNRGTAGFAYVGGACVVNKRLEKVNSVAIIEDSGGFSGIIVAAHEVGHLLGCVHDGSPPPSYLGGPGATHCPWEDGFIMSDLRHTERGFRWSQCSVEQFKHFLNGETATCLYNYPHESQMLHRLLPGTMLSLDEQCKRDRGTNACFKDARVCAQLFCFDSASGYCVSYRPAAEGSPCGEGQVCRNGKCVGEIENIIPDYTHQSQTVVARAGRPAPQVGPSHGLARLADNGLSASSTSTATSSPDSGKQAGSSSAAISSRMDSYPVESPLLGAPAAKQFGSLGYSSASYSSQFGGRHFGSGSSSAALDTMTSSPAGVVMARQPHPTSGQTTSTAAASRSAKLMASEPVTRQNRANKYQQRSGIVQQSPSPTSSSTASSSAKLTQKPSPRGPQVNKQPNGKVPPTNKQSVRAKNQVSAKSQPYQSQTSTSSSNININNDSDDNLLANPRNQFNDNHQQPSTSSIQVANSKQRSATYHTLSPRQPLVAMSKLVHSAVGGAHPNSNTNRDEPELENYH